PPSPSPSTRSRRNVCSRVSTSLPTCFRKRSGSVVMKPDVEIYDTTLRDGTQCEGITLTVGDKLRIAHRLDAIGVPLIEGGWPGSNPKDAELFQRARDESWKQASLCAFGSTRRAGL